MVRETEVERQLYMEIMETEIDAGRWRYRDDVLKVTDEKTRIRSRIWIF
jgi:hypothetical protein